jgi:hypothetical protein
VSTTSAEYSDYSKFEKAKKDLDEATAIISENKLNMESDVDKL